MYYTRVYKIKSVLLSPLNTMYDTGKVLLFLALSACAHGNPGPRRPGYGQGEQEWGWIDVRKGAHMFYWMYYTTAKVGSPSDRPLVMWLPDSPGGSSTGLGNFGEIGPIDPRAQLRQTAWTKEVNVLFVDNPVGSGYSYVDNLRLLTKNVKEIGADTVEFLREFYRMYPAMQKSKLYIFGESYGGKMAVEIAAQVQAEITSQRLPIELGGLGLIDPMISPVDSITTWPSLLLHTGLIDQRSYHRLSATADKVKNHINKGEYVNAYLLRDQLEIDVMSETNGVRFDNILSKVSPYHAEVESTPRAPLPGSLEEVKMNILKLMDGPVRQALKIPSTIPYKVNSPAVCTALKEDTMMPFVDKVANFLNTTQVPVTVISGQLDLRAPEYGTLNWIDNMRWTGSFAWKNAARKPLLVNEIIEGYVTKIACFSYYVVTRSGQMVPMDNPGASLEILRRMTGY